ncbi:MAG: CPBP family intramembrane metalloprotease [Chloroflexota bacterium]|nr:CPBP family intramembrane metalloprotease [Chloroflexota bacterium]
MVELFLVGVYALAVTGAANLAAERPRFSPLLAILTLGCVNLGGLWRLCAAAVRRLSLGEAPAFDPDKPIHRAAAFLLLLGFVNLALNSLIGGLALEGEWLAVTLSDAMVELFSTGALHLAVAFLGVGWFTRRRLPDVLRRLSLRMPTLREAGVSIAIGVGLWIFSTAAVAIWERAVPEAVFQQQTEPARLYFEVFSGSFVSALMLAVIPALSEEIFYRGALQPVFGVLLSSLFFTATHQQYGLTPALATLLAVSLGFAWLRLRFHTSAAIIAHAVFNFLPFLASV